MLSNSSWIKVGHSNPRMTLTVYARVMLNGDGERERLRVLVGDTLDQRPRALQAELARARGPANSSSRARERRQNR